MQRREFMAKSLAGGAVAALGIEEALAQTTKDQPADDKMPAAVEGGIQRYRVLGRTGLWVSDISLGTSGLRHPAVAVRAIELGINYFDTAPDYGDAEINLGKALKAAKAARDRLVITTKMCENVPYPGHLGTNPDNPATVADIIRCCEGSLKRLQVDYVDVLMVHALGEPGDDRRLDREELPRAIDQLKKQGKIRFAGASSHGGRNPTPILRQAIDSGFIDVLMPACNYLKQLRGSGPSDLDKILAASKEKNIGIIAMKTVPAERESQELTELRKKLDEAAPYAHLCFAWALAQPAVAGLVKTMNTIRDVEQYVGSTGVVLSAADQRGLEAYASALGSTHCRIGCSDCHGPCPADVPIADLLRFNEYFVNYGMERHALRRYADVGGRALLAACAGCDAPCERACPYDLPVRTLLAAADHNLHFDPRAATA